MDTIMYYNGIVNSFVWGAPVLILLVGTGVYLTLLLGMPQFRYFFDAMSEVFSFRKKSDEDKSITSFAAMATAMAATVGTGNVAGVATALHLGGPGALVWMLISAVFGMCTKFAEVVLAVHYRQKDALGDWRGGTMYILENGTVEALGKGWGFIGKILAILFALFAFLASFGIGAATQANSAAEAMSMGWGVDHLYSGIVMAVLVALVIIGGLKSLSTVTTYIVPFMAIFYIGGSAYVLIMNASMIPETVSRAVHLAFNNPLETLPGALAGWGVKEAVQRGIARGVFSNEAGMGSAPMVHATANVEHPVQQGFYGIFEVFMDTIVICTMTALVVMVTGTLTNSPDLTGAQLTLQAFENALGTPGKYVLSVGLLLFAFTTILGWYWYAETAVTYLFGVWCKPLMKIMWIAMILVGAAGAQFIGAEGNQFLNNIWDISDTLNGLMALPNLIGLLILSVTLKRIVSDYDEKYGTPSDRLLSSQQKIFVAKIQYIVMGLIAVAMGMTAFFAYRTLFAGLAIVLGLLTAYRRQTLLGFLAVILGIAAAAM
ncbi:MAG: sodium:alanine symporter family protein [Synergistaceae bacterium]|nr:sodium:alanine symporter family protein [Synergistaceae bacterium]MBQ4400848.1 sodium:alanine symporter family protein [Synergistaceae bacterium]MBQ6418447.1 sodium:alanine symporter family protein [Synergistaceae bacterium]MBQ6664862.1 sodium:alanine symporter family protein [Synergistaceae bacterium]MBR0184526.1 sodium:alanine symporter family protein [Synergistaceae bacterium]